MKFSIRDLMWFTVVVALVLGWGLEHWRCQIALHEASVEAHNRSLELEYWTKEVFRRDEQLGKMLKLPARAPNPLKKSALPNDG